MFSEDIALQPLALVFFGTNTTLLCVASWGMWQYASGKGKLLDDEIKPFIFKLISRLWLFPPLVIVLTMPLGFISVFPVYAIWFLLPVFSYTYSIWGVRRYQNSQR